MLRVMTVGIPRVLRVHHEGAEDGARARDRALAAAGVQLTLVAPGNWPTGTSSAGTSGDGLELRRLTVTRPGDVNRHAYESTSAIRQMIAACRPDILDIHEEPFSKAAHQWIAAAPPEVPIVMYTAQNIDKRLPPPFAQYEQRSHRRTAAMYPCSAQAASVARGKGFGGHLEVLPLGFDAQVFYPGSQRIGDDDLVLAMFGRLVTEKGVLDAVRVVAALNASRPSRLVVVGHGPEEQPLIELAAALGIADRVELLPWQPTERLAEIYRRAHVVLVTSRPTETWAEQFGRVIVEAQASGAVVAGYQSGAIPEVGGEAALLVETGDVGALAREVTSVLTDPAAFTRRRDLGLVQVRDLTWSRIAQRHLDLYRRTLAGEFPVAQLPRSPRRRRAAARAEFGPTAETLAGRRPFALPVLRRGGPTAGALELTIDTISETSARLPRLRRR